MIDKLIFTSIFVVVTTIHISLFNIEISPKEIPRAKKKELVFINLIEKRMENGRRSSATPVPDVALLHRPLDKNKVKPVVAQKILPNEKKKIEKRIEKKIEEGRRSSATPVSDVALLHRPLDKNKVKPVMAQKILPNEKKKIEKEYLIYIQNLVRSKLRYPRRARRLRKEGTVLISINIDKYGSIEKIKIIKKSSSTILDKAGIKVFKSIKKFKAIPKELKKDSWKITIPVVYRLR